MLQIKQTQKDKTKGIKEVEAEEGEKNLHHSSVSRFAKQSTRPQQQHTSKSKMDTFRKWWNKPKVKKNRTAHERRKRKNSIAYDEVTTHSNSALGPFATLCRGALRAIRLRVFRSADRVLCTPHRVPRLQCSMPIESRSQRRRRIMKEKKKRKNTTNKL